MKVRSIPFPKEYGSWGILLTSCAIGIFVSGSIPWHAIASLAGIALLFMTKAPIGIFMRRRDKASLLFTSLYTTAGIALLLPALLRIGAGHVLALSIVPLLTIIVYAVSAYMHKERNPVVEFFAMGTLTTPVPFFYLAVQGSPGIGILAIWSFTFLYFSASIFRVKMLILKKKMYRRANFVYLVATSVFVSAMIYLQSAPLIAAAAFAPLLENLVETFRHTHARSLRVIGIKELLKGVVFAFVIVISAHHTRSG